MGKKNKGVEEVKRFTDIGRNGNEPPEVRKGVLLETEEENYHYHIDPLSFIESASIAGGDFLPENLNHHESRIIRGILSSGGLEVEESHLGSTKGELDSRKTTLRINGEEIQNIEPHTAFLYGINSDSKLFIDKSATNTWEEFKEKRFENINTEEYYKGKKIFDWCERDAAERNWANVDEVSTDYKPKQRDNYEKRGKLDSFKILEGLSTPFGNKDLVGYGIDLEENEDIFVPHKPIDNQPGSYAFKILNMDKDHSHEDFNKKGNTSLALYLIDKFDVGFDIAAEFERPELGKHQDKIEEQLNIKKPSRMTLYNQEDEGIPISYVSRNIEVLPYSDRASKFISYLTARDKIDEFNVRINDTTEPDKLIDEMFKESTYIEKIPEYEIESAEETLHNSEIEEDNDAIGFQ